MKTLFAALICFGLLTSEAQTAPIREHPASETLTMEKACIHQVARGETIDGVIDDIEDNYWLMTKEYNFENMKAIYNKFSADCSCNKDAQCTVKFTTNYNLVKKVISYKKTK